MQWVRFVQGFEEESLSLGSSVCWSLTALVQCGAAEKAVSILCCPRVELYKWFHAVLSLAFDITGGGPELLPIPVCTIISSSHFQGPFILRNALRPRGISRAEVSPISHPLGYEILCGLGNLQLRSKFHSRGKGQRYLLCFWLSIQVASEREEGGRWLNTV